MSYDQWDDPASTQHAEPGWYPVDAISQRYWDGYEWTNHMAPLPRGQRQMVQGISQEDRIYAMIMHLGGIFLSFFVPLIMWLIRKDDSNFVDYHGRQALNHQLTMFILIVGSFILILAFIGILFFPIVIALDLIFGIVAAVRAYNGDFYRIPIAIPFF